jgi:probable O-glycosylation ligase (exosortase A-associated)
MWPAVGVGVWTWLSLGNPHREVYGALTQQPLVAMIAGITLVSWFLLERRRTAISKSFIAFTACLLSILIASNIDSLTPNISANLFDRHWKTLALFIIFYLCSDSKNRINLLLAVIVLSLAYWGVKGGLTFIASAGQHQFSGPSRSMIGDRNHLAVALVMVLPLVLYLARVYRQPRFLGWALYGVAGLTALAAIGTYSRGGTIALIVVIGLLALRAHRRIFGILFGVVSLIGLVVLVPQEFVDRMATIESAAEQDKSFQSRLVSWYVYFHAGLDHPITGVGPGAAQYGKVYFNYAPPEDMFGYLPDRGYAAHSLYFQVWGEYGVLGFAVYMGFILYTLLSLRRTRRLARRLADDHWGGELANALFIAIAGFCVGAAALSLAFYDGFLLLLALAAGLKEVVEQERREAGVAAPAPRGGRARTRASARRATGDGAALSPRMHRPSFGGGRRPL